MINYVWFLLIIIGILYSILTGNNDVMNNTILSSGNETFELITKIGPNICVWTGIMAIAEKSNLLDIFSKILTPILKRLFPSVPQNNKALGYIASNIAANMLGLGSVATPFGLKGFSELQKINPNKDEATSAMITFLVMNTAGVTLIPTMVLSLRNSMGSINPSSIIIPGIIATFTSNILGLILDYFIRKGK